MHNITIGTSACLQGHEVRYDSSAKRKQPFLAKLKEHMKLEPVCPEMSIGLGVPRDTIRLVGELETLRLKDSKTQSVDHTQDMQQFAHAYAKKHQHLSGFIGVRQSPSCGFDRVKRYNENGHSVGHDAQGVFIKVLLEHYPQLPIEEDGRLNDAPLRENFIKRVYTYHEWQTLLAEGLSHKKLQQFWARHKYSLMSHDISAYQQAGKLLANTKDKTIEEIAEAFITVLMQGLKKIASRKLHANVLHHIAGYLKRDLASTDREELSSLIHLYREQQVPLIVPLTMLKHHFKKHDNAYIQQQHFMQPYPDNLSLRNSI